MCEKELIPVQTWHFDNLTMRERERERERHCYLISVEKGLVRFE